MESFFVQYIKAAAFYELSKINTQIVKNVGIRSLSGLYFPVFGGEKIPYLGTFTAVMKILYKGKTHLMQPYKIFLLETLFVIPVIDDSRVGLSFV